MRYLLFFLFVLSLDVHAQRICGSETLRGQAYSWCITQGQSDEILYYMHGGGGSEKSWDVRGYAGFLEDRWAKVKHESPTVIVVSFGPTWLLTDMQTKEHPALLNLFVEEIMPSLEVKIPGKHGLRLLMGNSMGGYNGAELALRYPELWDRVALLCPGVYVTDPFQTDEEIEAYLEKQPATTRRDYVRGLVAWVRQEFQSRENWERHNPMHLAEIATRVKASYHLSCTKDDQYGFYDGAKYFAEVIGTKTKASFISMETGGHCALDDAAEDALAKFLAGL
jgi:pimeloyl-ACP methyl ester carboxylesterase